MNAWLLGVFRSVVLAGFGGGMAWCNAMYAQVHDHGLRIAVLESQMVELQRQLERMETKLGALGYAAITSPGRPMRSGKRPTSTKQSAEHEVALPRSDYSL